MPISADQLAERFDELAPLLRAQRPSRGWIRAVREALGMTTRQLAGRLGMKQPSLVELEKGEAAGSITIKSLERAAEALGCRFIYALVPVKPLTQKLEERAVKAARQKLAAVDQTMRLEDQAVSSQTARKAAERRLVDDLLRRPARLWDES
ncbi:MAG: mobile mystery protein A [Pseudolabrys sp.]|nr:mobile mystery protein A [Pseudolabrys sp.]MDP2296419.1 mobile mystery protein A [Pseudolabrys sp.]